VYGDVRIATDGSDGMGMGLGWNEVGDARNIDKDTIRRPISQSYAGIVHEQPEVPEP